MDRLAGELDRTALAAPVGREEIDPPATRRLS